MRRGVLQAQRACTPGAGVGNRARAGIQAGRRGTAYRHRARMERACHSWRNHRAARRADLLDPLGDQERGRKAEQYILTFDNSTALSVFGGRCCFSLCLFWLSGKIRCVQAKGVSWQIRFCKCPIPALMYRSLYDLNDENKDHHIYLPANALEVKLCSVICCV